MGGDTFENMVKNVMPNNVKEIEINYICDATRILAQYEERLDKKKNTVYKDCGHHQQICTECWNKLQEIKEMIDNEKGKIQDNQK